MKFGESRTKGSRKIGASKKINNSKERNHQNFGLVPQVVFSSV